MGFRTGQSRADDALAKWIRPLLQRDEFETASFPVAFPKRSLLGSLLQVLQGPLGWLEFPYSVVVTNRRVLVARQGTRRTLEGAYPLRTVAAEYVDHRITSDELKVILPDRRALRLSVPRGWREAGREVVAALSPTFVPRNLDAERGCTYCADEANMSFGRVREVVFDVDVGVLLECPRCSWLYLDAKDGSQPRHVAVELAMRSFPDWRPAA